MGARPRFLWQQVPMAMGVPAGAHLKQDFRSQPAVWGGSGLPPAFTPTHAAAVQTPAGGGPSVGTVPSPVCQDPSLLQWAVSRETHQSPSIHGGGWEGSQHLPSGESMAPQRGGATTGFVGRDEAPLQSGGAEMSSSEAGRSHPRGCPVLGSFMETGDPQRGSAPLCLPPWCIRGCPPPASCPDGYRALRLRSLPPNLPSPGDTGH